MCMAASAPCHASNSDIEIDKIRVVGRYRVCCCRGASQATTELKNGALLLAQQVALELQAADRLCADAASG